MSPLIAIAASILPEIVKFIVGDKDDAVSGAVEKVVSEIAGTSEPKAAQEKIQADPAIEKALKIKLAEIAAEQEEKRRLAELEARKLQIEELEKRQKNQIEGLKLQFGEDAKKRDDAFRRLQAGIVDTQEARNVFGDLARARNPFAWGPVVVSLVVAVGFFAVLGSLISVWQDPPAENQISKDAFQIVQIAIGALTAGFATMLSFWLGSSQGSRNKDFASAEIQARQVQETARIIKRQDERADVILQQRQPISDEEARAAKQKPSNVRRCIDIVLQKEGGYVDHPGDPGGPTNMGITFRTLSNWRGEKVSRQDVKDLTVEEARAIYEANYWKPVNGDNLPLGVDLVVFDFGVNAGPARSARKLQQVCGVNQDGVVGPITIGAVKSLDPERVIRRFGELRIDYYRSLKTWPTFGKGWTRRTEDVERAALEMKV